MKCHFLISQKIANSSDAKMCHAGTLLPLGETILFAWFGGSYEGEDDVSIYLQSFRFQKQSRLHRLRKNSDLQQIKTCKKAHWNPVLQKIDAERVRLYFKVGRKISDWQTLYAESYNQGISWTEPKELIYGDSFGGRGPVRTKILRTSANTWLAPNSVERGEWRAYVDRSTDQGKSWVLSEAIGIKSFIQWNNTDKGLGCSKNLLAKSKPKDFKHTIQVSTQSFSGRGVIQPALWESKLGHVHMLLRSTEGQLFRSDSEDDGRTWSEAYPTNFPNNNSGVDLVLGPNGVLFLVCNPISENWGKRTPLSLFASEDNGRTWSKIIDLEIGEGEFSYPAIFIDGKYLHLFYTWNREAMKYVLLKIEEEKIENESTFIQETRAQMAQGRNKK